jgi:hypothetical protein
MKIVTHNFPNASLGWDRQALDTQAFDVAAIVFSRSAQVLQLGSYVDGSLRFLATKSITRLASDETDGNAGFVGTRSDLNGQTWLVL